MLYKYIIIEIAQNLFKFFIIFNKRFIKYKYK